MEKHRSICEIEKKYENFFSILYLGKNLKINNYLLKQFWNINPKSIIYNHHEVNYETNQIDLIEVIYETNHPFKIHLKKYDNGVIEGNIYHHPMQNSELKLFINQILKQI